VFPTKFRGDQTKTVHSGASTRLRTSEIQFSTVQNFEKSDRINAIASPLIV
jgi:hypothetical protein